MSHHVHLVGSVPLPDARAVFTTVSAALGPHLKSIPDGETGERLDWITWLEPVFAQASGVRAVRRDVPVARRAAAARTGAIG